MDIIKKIHDYFRGAISELRKVTWPTKKQTINYSIVVIAIAVGVAVYFGVADFIFSRILTILIS